LTEKYASVAKEFCKIFQFKRYKSKIKKDLLESRTKDHFQKIKIKSRTKVGSKEDSMA
jgi:hypothetical protein